MNRIVNRNNKINKELKGKEWRDVIVRSMNVVCSRQRQKKRS